MSKKTNIVTWRITWGLGYFEDYNCFQSVMDRKNEFINNPPEWARMPGDEPRIIKMINDEVVDYDYNTNLSSI